MIGASKIDDKTDDLERLFAMISAGMNDHQIARTYLTNSGKNLSRVHIGRIRRGVQWNEQKRSFYMKRQLKENPNTSTNVNGDTYRTEIAVIFSKSFEFYVYLTFKNDRYIPKVSSPILIKKPTVDELLEFHRANIPNE